MTLTLFVLLLLIFPLLVGASYFGFVVFKISLLLIILLIVWSLLEHVIVRLRLHVGPIVRPVEITHGDTMKIAIPLELKTALLPLHCEVITWYGLSDRSVTPERLQVEKNLRPRTREVILIQLEGRHIGVAEVDEITLVLRSMFGIVKSKIRLAGKRHPLRFSVLPLADITSVAAEHAVRPARDGERERHRIEDRSDEVDTMRPYRPGDDIRRIHWPVSARLNEMVVKQYEAPLEVRTIIMLDSHCDYFDAVNEMESDAALRRRDVVLEACAGTIGRLLKESMPVRLEAGWGHVSGPFQKRFETLTDFRRELAMLPVDATATAEHMLADALCKVSADRYILFASRLSVEAINALIKLRRHAQDVMLYLLVNEQEIGESEPLITRLPQAGIKVVRLHAEGDRA